MSTVTVTPLVPGEAATSADANATITSWNNAAGTGDLGANNVRMEGIDRRTMSAPNQVVFTDTSGSFTPMLSPTGPVTNVTGIYAAIDAIFVTSGLVCTIDTQFIVHATVYMEGSVNDGLLADTVSLILQSTTNGGATWSDITGTGQVFSMRDLTGGPFTDPLLPVPAIATCATWSAYFAALAGTTVSFRVAYQTDLLAISFLNGTIFTETFPNS